MSYASIGPTNAPLTYTVTRQNAGPAVYTYNNVGYHRYKRGQTTKNYFQRIKSGDFLPYTPWLQFEAESQSTAGWHSVIRSGGYWERGDGCHSLCAFDSIPWAETPDMSSAAYSLQRAAADIYTQGWDGLTSASEFTKTVKMFRGTAKKVVNLARRFSPKRAHDAWLEGRYGYRTLAYDVRDLHNAVTEFDEKRNIHTARSGQSYSTYADDEYSFSDSDALYRVGWTEETSISIRGSIAAEIKPSRIITNPVLTAWELVPYSFVVDWIYDVGTAINAISFLSSQKQYTAATGYKIERSYVKWMTAEQKPGSSNTVTGPGYRNEFTINQVLREPSSLSLTPKLTNRGLDGSIALDLQALSRIRR